MFRLDQFASVDISEKILKMKLLITILVAIFAVVVIADHETDWLAFKVKFGKLFLSKDKETKRKLAFKKHKAILDDLQAKSEAGEILYEPAVYAFHDLEPEEFLARMTGAVLRKNDESDVEEEFPESRQTLPTNYSSVGILGAIKNQLQCGK